MDSERPRDPQDRPRREGDPSSEETIAQSRPEGAARDVRVPGYRILRELGSGGMGVVYEAEQEEPRRRVALKVIRGGAFVGEPLRRLFEREAQALAHLKHPGIAVLYETGVTEDGQPFFSMELADGVPLDRFLHARSESAPHGDIVGKMEIAFRLGLFLRICDAIGYAHQRGVIHRDLKPANILVASDPAEELSTGGSSGGSLPRGPRVKILDFGLARLMDAEPEAATRLTRPGTVQGTLAYMSPEQARGDIATVDLRSDVYSLGVLLFEMLTGELPHDLDSLPLHEVVRALSTEAPKRPGALNRALRGDLETIILKALAMEPERRYESVFALAGDIERYLGKQPILAHPPSTAYQLRKLVSRHKGLFAFAGTLLVLLAAFAIMMSVMYGVQRRERQRADAEREKAEAVSEFLSGMISSVAPDEAQGREVSVRYILDEAAKKLEGDLERQPEIRSELHSQLGSAYRQLGRLDLAEPHLRQAYEFLRDALGDAHPDVILSHYYFAFVLYQLSRFDEAEAMAREILAAMPPGEGIWLDTKPALLRLIGELRRRAGDYETSEQIHHESVELSRRLFGDEHPDVGRGLNDMALVYIDTREYNRAETLLREALAIKRREVAGDHPSIRETIRNLFHVLRRKGDYAEATVVCRELVGMSRRLYGEDHRFVSADLGLLAKVLTSDGDYEEVEAALREALDINLKNQDVVPESVPIARHNLAVEFWRQGRHAEAEMLLRQALSAFRERHGDEHVYVVFTRQSLGAALTGLGRLDEAEEELRAALAVVDDNAPPVDWLPAEIQSALGECLTAQGSFAEAESLLQAALPVLQASDEVIAARPWARRRCLERLVAVCGARGDVALAARYRAELATESNAAATP